MFCLSVWLLLQSLQIQFSVALGLLLMGAAALMPLRSQEEPWDLFWDLAGWLAAVAFAVLASQLFRKPLVAWIHSQPALQFYHQQIYHLPPWLGILGSLLVVDLLYYWGHRALHSRWLWDQHAWHHSPTYLTWLSGSRTTLVNHLILIAAPTVLTTLIFPLPRSQEAVVFVMAWLRLVDHLHHTNLRLPGSKWLEWVFITPRLHYVHHSNRRELSDSNYGLIFTWCDRLFGTYIPAEGLDPDFPLGLNDLRTPGRMLLGLPPAAREPQP